MTPTTSDQWTKESITELLTLGQYETEYFDFKEMLPNPKDDAGKERLKAACCAFANGSGGFLVFGVKDDSSLPIADRLVGLPPSLQFPEQFGNYTVLHRSVVVWRPADRRGD